MKTGIAVFTVILLFLGIFLTANTEFAASKSYLAQNIKAKPLLIKKNILSIKQIDSLTCSYDYTSYLKYVKVNSVD